MIATDLLPPGNTERWPMSKFSSFRRYAYDPVGEVGGWGRDPKKCTERDWGMGSSTI